MLRDLKKASEDGTLTPSEQAVAMGKAIDYFRGHITPGALQVLQAAYGPVEDWLSGYLEARLAEQKGGTVAVIGELANPI